MRTKPPIVYVQPEVFYTCPFCSVQMFGRNTLRKHLRESCREKPEYRFRIRYNKFIL